jgi:ribosomal protein S27AE
MTLKEKTSRVMEATTISKNVASDEKGKQCPRCGSTNTNKENNIWFCCECHYEW